MSELTNEEKAELCRLRCEASAIRVQMEKDQEQVEALKTQMKTMPRNHPERDALRALRSEKEDNIALYKKQIKEHIEASLAIAQPLREEEDAKIRALSAGSPFRMRNPVSRSSISKKAVSLRDGHEYDEESMP